MRITIIEPGTKGLNYLAIVETEGLIEPLSEIAFTSDRKVYDLDYETGTDPRPRLDVWDLGVVYTGSSTRPVRVNVKEAGKEIATDAPAIRDGL